MVTSKVLALLAVAFVCSSFLSPVLAAESVVRTVDEPADSTAAIAAEPTDLNELVEVVELAPSPARESVQGLLLAKHGAPSANGTDTGPSGQRFSGFASWYGEKFHGKRTASGRAFNMNDLTAAHRTLPFFRKVLVENPKNG